MPSNPNNMQSRQWAEIHFLSFLDDIKRTHRLALLSMQGITALQSVPQIYEYLVLNNASAGTQSQKDATKNLEEARKDADLAKREVDEGFPLIHAQFTVAIWTLLEEMIRSFLVSWIKNETGAMQVDEIRNLKIKLGEYESRDEGDRHLYIVELLEQHCGAGIKYGVERFEVLLKPFGLSGEVPKKLKTAIFECAQMRNCIVHKAGKSDAQLIAACPWLAYKAGEKIVVTGDMSGLYFRACLSYTAILLKRLADISGVSIDSEKQDQILSEWN